MAEKPYAADSARAESQHTRFMDDIVANVSGQVDLSAATEMAPLAEQSTTLLKELPPPDPNLVTWDGANDSEKPTNWSRGRKWSATLTISVIGLVGIANASIVAPALPYISHDLQTTNVHSQMVLSIYVLAIAFGPLVLGPLSELYGRTRVIRICLIWFFVWTIACGFARTTGLLIAARFLSGLGGSLSYAVGSGVLGDCWLPEQRGRSLALYSSIPLIGSAVGPIVGAYVVERTSWRWLFWVMAIAQAMIFGASFRTYHETHVPTLLHRKAENLRASTANPDLFTIFERQDAGRKVKSVLARSLSRPIRLLAKHPVIQVIALSGAVNYGILYIVLSTFSSVWTTRYHQSTQQSGLHYIAFVIGELLGVQIGAPLIDKVWKILKQRADGAVTPEYRIPLLLPGSLLVPIGLIWYGWSAQATAFWMLPDIGVALLGFGLMSFTAATQAYIIDAFPEHTASATAASSFLRAVFGFVFPLFAPKLYDTLGYGWGNTLLGSIAIVCGVVGPTILWKFGAALRAMAPSTY